jgi:hypothetical protein
MFHYFKILYFTCTFFTKFTYNEYIGPYFFITRCSTIFASELPKLAPLCNYSSTSCLASWMFAKFNLYQEWLRSTEKAGVAAWRIKFKLTVRPLQNTLWGSPSWDSAIQACHFNNYLSKERLGPLVFDCVFSSLCGGRCFPQLQCNPTQTLFNWGGVDNLNQLSFFLHQLRKWGFQNKRFAVWDGCWWFPFWPWQHSWTRLSPFTNTKNVAAWHQTNAGLQLRSGIISTRQSVVDCWLPNQQVRENQLFHVVCIS